MLNRLCWHRIRIGCTVTLVMTLGMFTGGSGISGRDAAAAEQGVDYVREVKPLLKARCYACHGALKQEAALRVDTAAAMRKGGDGGEAVVAGDLEGSLLLSRVSATADSERMPPEGEPLTAGQVDLIRRWIAEGAKANELEQPEADPRDHWAFQAPRQVTPPKQPEGVAALHPIDAFIAAELAGRGLSPRPRASKDTLLRRVTLDLIGLPPTRAELQSFLEDDRADAYERVVDRLLADPRHGERWGRHWMDVWRYSDWYGRREINDVRNSAGQIYRWRDWIVRSLNADKGYDRMLQEMLAADEIAPDDFEAGVATGFLIRNYYSLNPNDWMRGVVEHTGKAFLGLTFNCAHCHDHKYDPITNDEYFGLRAFFEPMWIRQDRVPGEPDPGPFEEYVYGGSRKVQRLGAVRVFDKTPDAPTWFYEKGDERNRVTQRGSIPPAVPAFLNPQSVRIEPVTLPQPGWYPGSRGELREALLTEANAAVKQAEAELASVAASPPVVPEEARTALTKAEAEYSAAVATAAAEGKPGALEGSQSLLLDAAVGRRFLFHPLSEIKTLTDGVTISLEIQLLSDAHFNVQLIRHLGQGLTATAVVFEKGRLAAYQPGGFTEFEAAKYDFASGQTRFQIELVLQPSKNVALLTVKAAGHASPLVAAVPIALNQWTPVGHPEMGFALDARTGAVVAVDTLRVTTPASETEAAKTLVAFGFEAPEFEAGTDPLGQAGFAATQFSVAPATSTVLKDATNPTLRQLERKLATLRRPVALPEITQLAAERKLAAAVAARDGVQSRISADIARYAESPSAEAANLARKASLLDRQARLAQAAADRAAAELALTQAELKPEAERAKAMETANKALGTAGAALEAARVALGDEKLAETYTPLSAQFPRVSTGRRKALALWMTSRENPLTARVAVNHIWMRHFHRPLVASVTDFGRNGDAPTHPALLDWLAVELMESGWSMKRLHRLIVTSEAYRRLSSTGDAASQAAADPENQWYWRMNVGRMEAEVVRDSLLAVSGRLDVTQGGVELDNREAMNTQRRSLYYAIFPEGGGQMAVGQLFDGPDPLDCYRRATSIVPQQALVLTNSELVHKTATAIVAGYATSSPAAEEGERSFVAAMFEVILSRQPSAAEAAAAVDVLEEQKHLATEEGVANPVMVARESLVRVLLNHNDFVTVR